MTDAAAKAREIAAALMSGNKRKADDMSNPANDGTSSKRARKKLYVPSDQFPDVNYLGLILGIQFIYICL